MYTLLNSREKTNLTNNPVELNVFVKSNKIEVNIGDEILHFTSSKQQPVDKVEEIAVSWNKLNWKIIKFYEWLGNY